MRHLSRWQLAIDGGSLETLSNGASGYPSATFFLAGPGSTVYHNPTLSVIRERALGKGSGEDLHEKLTVVNSGREELVVELSMTFDADFADLFEVKNKQLIKKGTTSRRVRGQEVELSYQREDFERRTIVHANGARLSQGSADFLLRLKPAESWSGTLRVSFESVAPRERTGATPDLPLLRSSAPTGSITATRWTRGSTPHRLSEPAGPACGTRTTGAFAISQHCACMPWLSPKARPFRQPGCHGSWLYSGATA